MVCFPSIHYPSGSFPSGRPSWLVFFLASVDATAPRQRAWQELHALVMASPLFAPVRGVLVRSALCIQRCTCQCGVVGVLSCAVLCGWLSFCDWFPLVLFVSLCRCCLFRWPGFGYLSAAFERSSCGVSGKPPRSLGTIACRPPFAFCCA